MHYLRIVCGVVWIALSIGCSANRKSIYHHQPVKTPAAIVTVDAKQRAILTALIPESVGKDGQLKAQTVRRFCSEPSPDVFSVIAQSLSGGVSFGKSGDPKAIEAALQAAFSDAEQGSTIPRTQTINMLRELMFRTCERYLSGAYDDLEMSIQALRDQRLIVSILAIEQLTGAVAPKPVSLGASGSASAGLGEAAVVRLDDALKAKEAAVSSQEKAQQNYDTLNTGNPGACETIRTALKEENELTDEQKVLEPKCTAARSALVSSKELAQAKSAHYAALRNIAITGGVNVSSTVSSSAPGGLDRAHNVGIERVSSVVREIVKDSFDDDTEMMIFCVKALTKEEKNQGTYQDLGSSCLKFFEKRVNLEEAKVESRAQILREETSLSLQRMVAIDSALFETIWPRLEGVLRDDSRRSALVTALKREILMPFHSQANCFDSARSKDQARTCFDVLPNDLKRNLPGVN